MVEEGKDDWNDPSQNEFGIDVERLRRNMAMTTEEKLARHEILLRELKKLSDARDEFRHRKSRPTPPEA